MASCFNRRGAEVRILGYQMAYFLGTRQAVCLQDLFASYQIENAASGIFYKHSRLIITDDDGMINVSMPTACKRPVL